MDPKVLLTWLLFCRSLRDSEFMEESQGREVESPELVVSPSFTPQHHLAYEMMAQLVNHTPLSVMHPGLTVAFPPIFGR